MAIYLPLHQWKGYHIPLPNISPPVILTIDCLAGFSRHRWAYAQKDIPDLDGRHGDGGHRLADAAAVHHHHEQIAAWDLLDDKGPVGTRDMDTVSGHLSFLR